VLEMNKKWRASILSLFALLSLGCGYHFSPGGENIDQSIKTVFVENISNLTSEATLENYIRNAFINEFRKGKKFNLAKGRKTADALLTGNIITCNITHLAYSKTDIAKKDRVNVTIEVVFKNAGNGEVIWINRDFTWREDFTVDSNPNKTEINKRYAIKKLSTNMAEKVYRSIISGF
jgi:hypothetical protein